jgi:hypothetical protein
MQSYLDHHYQKAAIPYPPTRDKPGAHEQQLCSRHDLAHGRMHIQCVLLSRALGILDSIHHVVGHDNMAIHPETPYQSRIYTNYAPTDAEREEIIALCVEPQQEIERINEEIQLLLDRRQELMKFVDAHRMLCSPVRQLSPEILQKIFLECLPSPPVGYPVLHHSQAPMLLGRVCSRWREIAYGSPELWTALHIHIFSSDSSAERTRLNSLRLEAIDQWFSRSGSFPLDISLHTKSTQLSQDYPSDFDYLQIISPYAKALLPFSSRWRSLKISFPPRYLVNWKHLTAEDVPVLREFILHAPSRWPRREDTGHFTPLDFLSQTSLTSFSLDTQSRPGWVRCEVPHIPRRTLTHLNVQSNFVELTQRYGSFFGFLSGCINLKSLYIEDKDNSLTIMDPYQWTMTTLTSQAGFGLPGGSQSPELRQTTLPLLEVLSMYHQRGSYWTPADIWATLYTPKLNELSFSLPFSERSDVLRQLLDRSPYCSAIHITIRIKDLVLDVHDRGLSFRQYLEGWFRQCSSIDTLTITNSLDGWDNSSDAARNMTMVGNALLDAIFTDAGHQDQVCLPRLKTLTLKHCFAQTNASLIHAALRTRVENVRQYPDRVSSLERLNIVLTSTPRDPVHHQEMVTGLQAYGTEVVITVFSKHNEPQLPPSSAFDGMMA